MHTYLDLPNRRLLRTPSRCRKHKEQPAAVPHMNCFPKSLAGCSIGDEFFNGARKRGPMLRYGEGNDVISDSKSNCETGARFSKEKLCGCVKRKRRGMNCWELGRERSVSDEKHNGRINPVLIWHHGRCYIVDLGFFFAPRAVTGDITCTRSLKYVTSPTIAKPLSLH